MDRELSRREFGKLATVAAAALGLGNLASAQNKKLPIAVQMYTLRDLTKIDFKGTMAKVAKIGYTAVEFAGYGGLTAPQVKQLLQDLGLQCAGTHEGYEALTAANIDQTVEFNKAIGNSYVVCPSMPGSFRDKGADGIKEYCDAMNLAGEKISQAGMQLCYHNHDFEFKTVDGQTIYDVMLQRMDAKLVKMEVDTYWVQHANLDPIALINKLGKRCALLHMKDMSKAEPHTFAPVGMGRMDIRGIVKAGKAVAVAWYVVEQDVCQGPADEAIAYSYDNLSRILK
jgi:sugar phosphate isomerase/epimerase